MSASGSLFTATITLLDVMPARCWIAPEIPSAMYRSGVTVFPVCPTCSSFGRQPAFETATTRHDHARLAERHALARRRGGLEAHEPQLLRARVGGDPRRADLERCRGQRPRAGADREDRRRRNAQRR